MQHIGCFFCVDALYKFTFYLLTAMCLCTLQYIVIPTRRSSAEAVQILLSHALGDAGSPYLVGLVSLWCCIIGIESFSQLCEDVFYNAFCKTVSDVVICKIEYRICKVFFSAYLLCSTCNDGLVLCNLLLRHVQACVSVVLFIVLTTF